MHNDRAHVFRIAGNGKTVPGRFRGYVRDDRRSGSTAPAAVRFDFSPDRKGVHPQTRLAAFHGIVQADASRRTDVVRIQSSTPNEMLLTQRQIEVLRYVADGVPNKVIADKPGLSE